MRAPAVALVVTLAVAVGASAGCYRPVDEPLKLERNMLTVDNRSREDWTRVEIWLNTYYRITTPSVRAGSRFQAPLDTFVAGFGQRFDFRRAQVRDLRLTATLSDGKPLVIKKRFDVGGLAGVLGGKR
jgi:hypothetical protein